MRYSEFLANIARAENTRSGDTMPSLTGCRYFDYSPGQPNLYLLMRFKQALVAEFGLERGFAVYRQTVTRHARTPLCERLLESQLAFSVTGSAAFTELAPAGVAFTVERPRIIGPSNHRMLSASTRSFYIACLADVRIRGRSEVINTGDSSLIDFQGVELYRIDDETEFDSAVFHCAKDAVVYDITPESDAGLMEVDEGFTLLG